MMTDYNLVENTFMVPYTKEVADYCDLFSCGDEDLDDKALSPDYRRASEVTLM